MITRKIEQPCDINIMPGDTITIKHRKIVDGLVVSEDVVMSELITTKICANTVAVIEFEHEFGMKKGVGGIVGEK